MSRHPISLSPSTSPFHRDATRLPTMIHELHKAGHQRIRFSSGRSPSGCHWGCSITHAGNKELACMPPPAPDAPEPGAPTVAHRNSPGA